jgi:hypothetical protein
LPTYLSLDFVSEDLENRRVLPGGILGVEPGSANPDTCRPEAKTDTSHAKVSFAIWNEPFLCKSIFLQFERDISCEGAIANEMDAFQGVIGNEKE